MKRAAVVIILAILCTACASYIDLSSTEAYLRRGEYGQAYQSLQQKSGHLINAQGPLIASYDLGLLAHFNGDWSHSNELLSDADRRIQEAYTKSITANIASLLINDNTIEYGGEEYESIYLNLFKALNYLHLNEEESALVELRRLIEKQSLLQDAYEVQSQALTRYARANNIRAEAPLVQATSFTTSALANYLTAVVADALNESSTAEYAIQQITHAFESQPTLYPFPLPKNLVPSHQTDLVHLIALSGRSPIKQERTEYLGVSYDNYVKIAYPILIARPSAITTVRVRVDGKVATTLERIESLSTVAAKTFEAKSELLYSKATMRAFSKALGIGIWDATTTDEYGQQSLLGEFVSLIFRVSREVSESADLRSTHFLPAQAWVGTIPITKAAHIIEFEYLNRSNSVIHTERFIRTIDPTELTILESYSPL